MWQSARRRDLGRAVVRQHGSDDGRLQCLLALEPHHVEPDADVQQRTDELFGTTGGAVELHGRRRPDRGQLGCQLLQFGAE